MGQDKYKEAPQDRLLPLQGLYNVRDLGGYPAAGGKQVRWGLLYRA
ncbi:MAG: tyrosine-protein phosphatase, partial [Treponema sp.]|nr:tyrosine-protein phosphatase [Treponema sp.]